ncbi:tRNA glutamyl-Q(34) synthetase GluQRS [Propioniciclava tarda]|uniref:Glutamyl-Q tRNA(Asp) synthetase n=1 Tax=Propioniciclava tarda TaxID=433330 RepID=A0A4Q9KJE9_PROTD|nr:tRNA glutamyl-Q(34) synthetase GluQRS [Propioniciclava tarda]TBT94557.1 tRNA glutamyl-Q(34) synthetase GluQRS [Propioniciclava tarda]SMO68556.1 glutamyl-tRNA synthetase [Propioniciclava tarda]
MQLSPAGRFAPSPTSDLHLGNLRTALVAWLMARSTGRRFLVRIEDLDADRVAAASGVADRQLRDLAALGLDWDGEVVRQSDRIDLYADALAHLPTYECFCTRREIAESASAPHDDGYRPYGGTCRGLSDAEAADRRRGRPPALRIGAAGASSTVTDLWNGPVTGLVDDFVVRRNDGAYAYNLAVVVDDLAQGVDQVVRGDDLLSSSPRQAWLIGRLGGGAPQYAHVPLVLNQTGRRLAKRDGAVTLADLADAGIGADGVRSLLGHSLGLNQPAEPISADELLARWDPARLPREPWLYG